MSGSSPTSRFTTERRARAALEEQARDLRRAAEDDILIEDSRRLLLRSPNGHYWSLTVDDGGNLTATDIGDSL